MDTNQLLLRPISSPPTKKRRRAITNNQRAQFRKYATDESHPKPSHKEIQIWFNY